MSFLKSIFILLGTLSLFVGVLGIVLPGLPTTPFLLLTAGLYIKSSDKLYTKLIASRFVGSYILTFNQRKGMTRKSKIYTISTMWAMIALSCIFFIEPFTIILVVSACGIIGTIVMGIIVPTVIN